MLVTCVQTNSSVMSKVKGNKRYFKAKFSKSSATDTNSTATTKKKKQHMKKKFKNKQMLPEKRKAPQSGPPTDPQQLSANWKILQEILKASQPQKKQTVDPKHQNGVVEKKADQTIPKDNVGRIKKDSEKKIQQTVSQETPKNSETSAAPEARTFSAPKRKQEGEKSLQLIAAKKKKKKTLSVSEETKPTEEDLWFDDVDPDDVEATVGAEAAEIMRKKQGLPKPKDVEGSLVKERAFEGLTRVVAIDCEMVGVGFKGEDSILARVSLVNHFGKCIYDKYVKPTEKVTDYRTAVSGIRPDDIRHGENVQTVQKEVADILQGRIVVGHAIHNDLKILLLDHPKKKIRDTQKYKPFRKIVQSGRPSLKALCKEILHVKVQQGEHSSVQDAQATMRLYTLVKKQWEAEIKASHKNKDSNEKREGKAKFHKNKSRTLKGS
ncbi:RNA exonuclease 4 [Gouania willdenowi]|uniref:RNA exonuclease 4 n=1 Tax=Gouania willdenowi TaxID=441366 RepID=A0A8C5GNZ5_GOUWI|nr:RNA exonuclease 4 [Gouania willdenowi]